MRYPFGKDNALAAQHYLMLQAQAMGLGSSIMGYAQVAPKILARHLDVPKHYKVYGVVAVGRAQAPVPADRRAQARQCHLGDRRRPARMTSSPVASAS